MQDAGNPAKRESRGAKPNHLLICRISKAPDDLNRISRRVDAIELLVQPIQRLFEIAGRGVVTSGGHDSRTGSGGECAGRRHVRVCVHDPAAHNGGGHAPAQFPAVKRGIF